jgi:hypothetical protein
LDIYTYDVRDDMTRFTLVQLPTASAYVRFSQRCREDYYILGSNIVQSGRSHMFRSNLQPSRIASSDMLRRVALVRTDVSEEPSASFFRVKRIGESQKTQFFIVTAVKTSNLT